MHKIWNILKYMSVFIQFHLLFVYLHSFYKMCKNKCLKNNLSVHFFYCHNYLKVFNSFLFERYLLIYCVSMGQIRAQSFFLILTSFYLLFVGVGSYGRT